MENAFRAIPRVDDVLALASSLPAALGIPRSELLDAVRGEIDRLRVAVRDGHLTAAETPLRQVAARAVAAASAAMSPSLRPVINATGVLLHTNLGRAPLGQAALTRAVTLAAGYSNLEYDLAARDRGDRYGHCATSLAHLTGAEAAVVVNNNAAAMVLILAALAQGKEAIVSRGELIEIGGSFRLPEVFATSGVRLVEVGTTNRTYLRDYEAAIRDETRLLVKAHRSNFDIVGFTEEVGLEALAGLGRARSVPTVYDLGSGALVGLEEYGLTTQTVPAAVRAGIDLVAFSGDKLLGGPQAGIIVGRADLVARLRKHPLMRALRVDKLTLAVLEATLDAYRRGTHEIDVPLFEMLAVPVERLRARAAALALSLGDLGLTVEVVDLLGRVGGGTLPTADVRSAGLRVRSETCSATAIDAALRRAPKPIIGRLEDGSVLLDLRTVRPEDDSALRDALSLAAVGEAAT